MDSSKPCPGEQRGDYASPACHWSKFSSPEHSLETVWNASTEQLVSTGTCESVIESSQVIEDATNFELLQFTHGTIRRAFIRKVYLILFAVLFLTTVITLLFFQYEGSKNWIQKKTLILYIAIICMSNTFVALGCWPEFSRKAPRNLIALFAYTWSAVFLSVCITIRFRTEIVLMGVGMTATVCLALCLFSFQTKWDFTVRTGALLATLLVFFLQIFIGIVARANWWHLLLVGISVLLFSIYLIHNTTRIIRGSHSYAISPEEYIFAALTLFLDIFFYISHLLVRAVREH